MKPGVDLACTGVLPQAAAMANTASATRVGRRTAHHLDQRHGRHRVEEVHADEPLRAAQGAGDRGDGQRRGVGGQDRIGSDHGLQLAEQAPLDGEILDDGLDHESAGAKVGEVPQADSRPSRAVRSPCAELAAWTRCSRPRRYRRSPARPHPGGHRAAAPGGRRQPRPGRCRHPWYRCRRRRRCQPGRARSGPP